MIYLYERMFESSGPIYLSDKERVNIFYTPDSRYDLLCILVDEENKPYKKCKITVPLVEHLIGYKRGK